mgnify:CR=1 FL=1
MSQHSARLPYHQLSSKAFMGLVNVSETIKREAPFFSERERAAFRWAVIITATPHSDASDDESRIRSTRDRRRADRLFGRRARCGERAPSRGSACT